MHKKMAKLKTNMKKKKKGNKIKTIAKEAQFARSLTKKNVNKTTIVAKEIQFARSLASNDKKVRDKVLKSLKKWLTSRSQSTHAFTEEDFSRLWKGLFYSMWMSDKPLVQEELAEALSKIIHCFTTMDNALLYTKCTFKSLCKEWTGLDRYRMDKFEMLVRRILRQVFEVCKKQSWNKNWVQKVANIIEEILIDSKTCLGFSLHVTEIYLEELAKVSQGIIPKGIVTEFVRPFVVHLSTLNDIRQIKSVVKHIFKYLIMQSDVGMDYCDKFEAWRNAGFPCHSIEEIELVELDDKDNDDEEIKETASDNKPLDPRAGKVNVDIPQIPFDANEISDLLTKNKFNEKSTTLGRKHMSKLIEQFNELGQGKMPIGIKKIEKQAGLKYDADEAAQKLMNFEDELYADSSKNKKKVKATVQSLKIVNLKKTKKGKFTKNKKPVLKGKDVPWLAPVLAKFEQQKKITEKQSNPKTQKAKISKVKNVPPKTVVDLQKTPKMESSSKKKVAPRTDSAKKRVTIDLKNNTEQHTSEYIRQLKKSPAIPFDANKKPKSGVLKPSLFPSPINPFYKKRLL